MTACDDKTWIEYRPGSQARIDALVLRAIELGHASTTAVASFCGLTYSEAVSVIGRLRKAGRLETALHAPPSRDLGYQRAEARARRARGRAT